MSNIDQGYIDGLTLVAARNEAKRALEIEYGLIEALRDLPEFPPPFILARLSAAGIYPQDSDRGKTLQQKHGTAVIPPKQECEQGAGFWERLRAGLKGSEK